MKSILTTTCLGLLANFAISGASFSQEEIPTTSEIESVGLFKNGLGVVTRSIKVTKPGVYRINDVPTPVHGTFWIESTAQVTTRVTTREITEPLQPDTALDFQQDLVGREVVIHFSDGNIPPASGTVLAIKEPDDADRLWNRSYEQSRNWYFQNSGQVQHATSKFLILKTADGQAYIDSSKIAYLQTQGNDTNTVTRERPVLLVTVPESEGAAPSVHISYLSKGIAWAPSYRIDISDPKKLRITQKAVIKNELESMKDAAIELISGFSSVQFAAVISPLALETTWSSFFSQLNQDKSSSPTIMSNAISLNQTVGNNWAPNTGTGTDLSATPTGEGVDLHHQPVGKHTLAEGDALALTVDSAEADYQRIVEWVVPDTRDPYGRPNRNYNSEHSAEDVHGTAWDALRFKNPFEFPMTTGAAMVTANGKFNGQRTSFWVNPGEQTTLPVTKALSVRVLSTEQEDTTPAKRKEVYLGSSRYYRVPVAGNLTVNNHRKEPIKLVIRRQFSGDLTVADGKPESRLREEGIYSVNRRNELVWTVELGAGEELKLDYGYTVLVPH